MFRLASLWIVAFADDLAVICPSAIRLSRYLTRIRGALSKLWLVVSLKKTEVVMFSGPGTRTRRPQTVRIGTDVVPSAASFKYLGVTITSKGQLTVHQKAIFSKAKVAAYEVAKLLRNLEITSLSRLASYLQAFVDGQFYGLELLPMNVSEDIDSARKLFVCTCFNLPAHTAKNLTYALFPVLPPLFLLLRRRALFYKRAQVHDLDCVREAFLFDMSQLYPHATSWTFQLHQMFQAIDIDMSNDILRFPRHLDDFSVAMSNVELVCFHVICFSEEKTLSFFRAMPTVEAAASFRAFLSSRPAPQQDFLLLFLTSGLRWRFFVQSARGASCPLCSQRFWSWEHFLSCPMCPARTSVPEFHAMIALNAWEEIVCHVKRVVILWLGYFDETETQLTSADVLTLFAWII